MNHIKTTTGVWRTIAMVLAMLFALAGCARQDPLINPPAVNVPDLSMSDMEAAIFDGCAKRGWSPTKIQEGVVEATLYLREHMATVKIAFLPGRFTIKYVRSEKLNYGKDKNGVEVIHPHYNDWVQFLKNDINVAMAQKARTKK
jgi:predicted small lipoprotein YifL